MQLLVGHGKINDATKVRHEFERNNADIKFFQQNDNPLDVLFKEKSKFDVQNPIIGRLLEEIKKGRITEKDKIEAVKNAPNIKDLDIEEKFNKIFERKKTGPTDYIITPKNNGDDDDDDDDNDGGINYPKIPTYLPASPIGRRAPSPQLPERRPKPGDSDDEWKDERTRQECFFPFSMADGGPWRVPRREINLDQNLKDVFGEGEAVLNEPLPTEPSAPTFEVNNYFADQLDRGEIPEEILFYRGGEGASQLQRHIINNGLEIGNESFVEFLATEECQEALARDGISIHVPTGQIFVNNENIGESIFDFLRNQQDETKKKIPLDFSYDDDYYDYMTKYLPGISESEENQYDFNSFKTSKFLFHLFNKFQEVNGRNKQSLRHTKLSDDNYALGEIQDRNWPYFIDKIIEYSQGFLNLSDVEKDITELNILRNTRDNFEILKGVYDELLNAVAISLHQFLKEISYLKRKEIETDLRNNNFETFDPQEAFIQNRILQTCIDFFYKTGRFPGNQRLISIPRGRIPSFINSEDVISPRYLYERYLSRDMSGLVSVQFLAALNQYLGGNKEISRNAMSEFFHNLSWQALAADNDGILLQFDKIGELIHSINSQLSSETNRERAEAIKTGLNFRNVIDNNFQEEHNTVQQNNENLLVNDIINGETSDYKKSFQIPIPKTEDEITDTIRQNNIDFLEGELAKNERDFEIAAELDAKKQADLLRNILDPGLGLITNEDPSCLDAIVNDNGDSIVPQLDPVALRGMEGLLNNLKQSIELSSDEEDTDDVKPPPDVFYLPTALNQPNLQDILTNDNQNSETLNEVRAIKDKIKTEVEEIISPSPSEDFPGYFDNTEFYQQPPQPPQDPFANATAPTLDPPPPYTYPTAPPYDDSLPPDYDDLFPTEPVSVRQIPLSDDNDTDNENNLPPDPRLIYTLVPPEVEIDDSVNDPRNLIGNPNVNVILPQLQGDLDFPPLSESDWSEESVEDPGYNDDDIDFTVTPITNNTTTGSLLYNNRRNEIYRRNARRRALNILAKKRKIKAAAAAKKI